MEIANNHPSVKFGKTGVLIVNLGHGVLPETNPDTVDYMVKLIRDFK